MLSLIQQRIKSEWSYSRWYLKWCGRYEKKRCFRQLSFFWLFRQTYSHNGRFNLPQHMFRDFPSEIVIFPTWSRILDRIIRSNGPPDRADVLRDCDSFLERGTRACSRRICSREETFNSWNPGAVMRSVLSADETTVTRLGKVIPKVPAVSLKRASLFGALLPRKNDSRLFGRRRLREE